MSKIRSHIMVCGGTGCVSSSSEEIISSLKSELKKNGYDKEIKVVKTGCFGFCGQGPIVKIHPDNVFYVKVKPEDAKEIIEEQIIKGRKVERLLYSEPVTDIKLDEYSKMNFYKKNNIELHLETVV